MPHMFSQIAYTPAVKALQEAEGSRQAYARHEEVPDELNGSLSEREAAFIAARDSFYMATVNADGWPYIQHRGGPAGFMRVLGPKTLGFADFRGNRQYVSLGNLSENSRVSLFFMDYPNRTRLKLFGHARLVTPDDHATLERLALPDYRARVERGFVIDVAGFDWNCPQHITPRFSLAEIEAIRQA